MTMTTETKPRCSCRIHSNFSSRLCTKPGTVQENGHWLCKAHSTEGFNKRQASRDAKWAAEGRANERITATAKKLLTELREVSGAELKYAGGTYGRDGVRDSVTIPFNELKELIAAFIHNRGSLCGIEDCHDCVERRTRQ